MLLIARIEIINYDEFAGTKAPKCFLYDRARNHTRIVHYNLFSLIDLALSSGTRYKVLSDGVRKAEIYEPSITERD